MTTVKDFKGRVYNVLEMDRSTTLLQSVSTGDYIRIRSWGWDDIGFVKP